MEFQNSDCPGNKSKSFTLQRRILIVRTDRVGDVVMITPMIRELRKKFPDSYIATLTNPNSADLLVNNPHLDEIITDDLSKDTFSDVTAILRRKKFTDGLLVMPTERAAYQMFLAGIRNRIGVGRKLYEVITFMKSVSRNNYIPLRHEADYCMDLARALGVETENIQPEIFLDKDEQSEGGEKLLSLGCQPGIKKIIVHTGSGGSSRNWSEEKYLTLIDSILKEFRDITIVLTAMEMSDSLLKTAMGMDCLRIVDARSEIKRLRDLIKITANCDMLIAASTGPLHIAAALGLHTAGLYCHRPMNCARHWGAIGPNAVNLEVSKEFCDANCSSDKEQCNFENGLSVNDVIELIRENEQGF